MKRILAIFVARNRSFFRDRATMSWNFMFPFFIVLGLGFAFNDDGSSVYKVGLLESRTTTPLLGAFAQLKHLSNVAYEKEDEALDKLRHHKIDMVITQRQGTLHYWINSTSSNGYLLEKIFWGTVQAPYKKATITSKEVRYIDWLLPGIIAMNMMFSALFGVGYTIVRYRANGVLKRFNTTPLSAFEFLTAQVASRVIIALFTGLVIYIGSNFFFNFQCHGSYLTLFVIYFVGIICLISMSLLVAARIRSDEVAGGLLNLLSWPMMMLSGVWFSLEGLNPIIQKVALIFPLTHLIQAARAVMNDGASLFDVRYSLLTMALFTVFFVLVSASMFKWSDR